MFGVGSGLGSVDALADDGDAAEVSGFGFEVAGLAVFGLAGGELDRAGLVGVGDVVGGLHSEVGSESGFVEWEVVVVVHRNEGARVVRGFGTLRPERANRDSTQVWL